MSAFGCPQVRRVWFLRDGHQKNLRGFAPRFFGGGEYFSVQPFVRRIHSVDAGSAEAEGRGVRRGSAEAEGRGVRYKQKFALQIYVELIN